MYERSAAYYDGIYRAIGKDYAREAERVRDLANAHRRSAGRRLLDVACGTGRHLEHFRHAFEAEGLERSETMLALARERLGELPLHAGDMREFDLARRFDVVTCLFSAIGHLESREELEASIAAMARHLEPGGVLIVEPWIHPDEFRSGLPFAAFVDEPDLKLARLNVSRREGDVAVLDFHYLVATPDGIERFTECERLVMFDDGTHRAAFRAAGLEVEHDPEGLMGRGLYLGVAPGPGFPPEPGGRP